MFIISRCLVGVNCKYNGGNNRNENVLEFCRHHSVFTVCPESAAGLPRPRPPAEYQKTLDRDGTMQDCIIDKEGKNLTVPFKKGAEKSLFDAIQEARLRGEVIEGAILKKNSPSCGYGAIYDGTFQGNLITGDGVFAAMLRKMEIPVYNENSEYILNKK